MVQTTTLLRSARILRRVLETQGNLLSQSDSSEKPPVDASVKKITNGENDNYDPLRIGEKFKFFQMKKWYRHNPESVLEDRTHKLIWDFEIQTDHLILARRLDLIIKKKKKRTCRIVDFALSVDHTVKLKDSKKKVKYLDFAKKLKNCGT